MQSQSGTGKTAVFCLGALQRVDINERTPQVLILSPTRELALQTQKVALALGSEMKIQVHACFGGMPREKDIEVLDAGVHMISGTPGRVYDMIQKKFLNTSKIKMIILDEADEMLARGFK